MIHVLLACLTPSTDVEVRLYRAPGEQTACVAEAVFLGEQLALPLEAAEGYEVARLTGDPARFVRLEVSCGRAQVATVLAPDMVDVSRLDLRLEAGELVRTEPATEGGARGWLEGAWFAGAGAWGALMILLAARLRRADVDDQEPLATPDA